MTRERKSRREWVWGQAFSRQVISPVTMVISLITGGPRGLLPARWEGGGGAQ